jgi:pyruvate formate lyase activating enzyme
MERMSEKCDLCPFECNIPENAVGKCKVRGNVNGHVIPLTYGHVTTMIEGPIEQKPLYHFYPKMKVLSIGSSGCNMVCAYCQNFEISQVGDAKAEIIEPMVIVNKAKELGCAGIAFTYSEPLVWYEYVMNVAVAAKKSGLKTILKTNGWINKQYFSEMMDWIDAVNIDVKGSALLYKEIAGIELEEDPSKWLIMANLHTAARKCHVEISTIAIPPYCDINNSRVFAAMRFVAGSELPIHILKFIPDFKMRDSLAPTMEQLRKVEAEARFYFKNVYIDYAGIPAISYCNYCNELLVKREGLEVTINNLIRGKKCRYCLKTNNFEGIVDA